MIAGYTNDIRLLIKQYPLNEPSFKTSTHDKRFTKLPRFSFHFFFCVSFIFYVCVCVCVFFFIYFYYLFDSAGDVYTFWLNFEENWCEFWENNTNHGIIFQGLLNEYIAVLCGYGDIEISHIQISYKQWLNKQNNARQSQQK